MTAHTRLAFRTFLLLSGAVAAVAPAYAQDVPPAPTDTTTQQPSGPSAPMAADAQSPATAQDTGLQEIVVTAQKRSENLQRVPIAVTAVSGAAIENLHAATVQDLQGTTPNIQINNFSNTPNTAVFTIRGIGVIEPDPYAGNTVSIVVDGVPQFFSMGALVDLYDVSRVEILRGPQGTLFGANTTGGVVNIATAQPTGEWGGKAEATLGNYGRKDAAVALNFPIGGGWSGKVVSSLSSHDGYTRNAAGGDKMGERNVWINRGYLKYDSGNFDATLIGQYDMARNGAPIVVSGAYPGEAIYLAPGTAGMYVSPCQVPTERCHAPDKYVSANNSVPDQSDMDTWRGTLTMNLRDTAAGTITSITGYKHFKLFEYTDQDGTPVFFNDTRRETTGWQLSQELRTAADLTDSINIIAGAFYLKTHYDHEQDYRLQFAAPGLLQINTQDQDNYSLSGFAQAYWQLTEQLRLQGGIRYTHERTEMDAATITSVNLSGQTNYEGTGNVVLSPVIASGKKSWDKIGWKVGADYQVTPSVLAYASWARGFKSGGFTGRLGIARDIGPFDPETVDTYEVGFKGDFLDRHLRINLAGFYTDYKDLQVAQIYFINDPQTGLPVQGNTILNAGKARIKGFELETTAVPFDGLTLTGSLAYLDAEYTDFPYINPLTLQPTNLKGLRLQNSPEWSATAGASYRFEVGEGSVTANVLYSYTASKYLTAILDTPRSFIQPTHLVNANVDWAPNENLTIGVWARNLLDNRYLQSVYDSPGYGGIANYAEPRMYGVTVKTSF